VKLPEAIETEPELLKARDEDPAVRQLLDIGVKLEGLYRHPSTHAAGIVIGDRPLDQLVPLFRDPRSDMPVTQYNMKWVEKAGLVKFDFLGLKTLTVLSKTAELLKAQGKSIDLDALPLNDEKTYETLARGETVGIFQLESAGMRDALKTIRPDRFEDIIALVALYRPGPMDNIPTYAARKQGREAPDYLHPKLEPILSETYGVIIYQEQVMQIAQELSGYSLGEADLLRRAMGKKIRAEMEKQRDGFVKGAVKLGTEKGQAEYIFELVAKFADYGFNKSHAAAYALVAYQTAYLKANHPVEFLAALMTLDMGNTDKIAEYVRDAKRLGIDIVPPSINASFCDFSVRDGAIIYALGALKNVGRSGVQHLTDLRANRPFASIADFAERIDTRDINKRMIESMICAGAFDVLEPDRGRLFMAADAILKRASHHSQNREKGQDELFCFSEPEALDLPEVEPWSDDERLQRERETVGLFITGHPLDDYGEALKTIGVTDSEGFKARLARGHTHGRLAGVVISRQEKRGRKGSRYAIVNASDLAGQYEIFVFSETLGHYGELLEPGRRLIFKVEGELRNDELRLTLQGVEALDNRLGSKVQDVHIHLAPDSDVRHCLAPLKPEGGARVRLVVPDEEANLEICLELPGAWHVTPDILRAIKATPGVINVDQEAADV